MTTLYVREGDHFRVAPTATIVERAQHLLAQRFRAGSPVLAAPDRVREFLRVRLSGLEYEVFAALFLCNRLRLIEYVELFRGTLTGASVHPREVVKEALARNAAAVIFVHNHPSGDSSPSDGDRDITRQLEEALALVDIRVVDHLIVGETITSFAESGFLEGWVPT
jgi:DNA repair protein RadC